MKKQITILDLDNLSISENVIFNQVALQTRSIFDDLINRLSVEHLNNINWIVGSIASRNKYQSQLFYRCVQIEYLNYHLSNSSNDFIIITSDFQLSKALKDNFKNNYRIVNIKYSSQKWDNRFIFIKPLKQYIYSIYIFVFRFLSKKNLAIKNILKENLILIDTFILNSKQGDEGSLINGIYSDRYFTGLIDTLTESEKSRVYFMPTIIGFRNIYSIFRNIRNSSTQFLIHDDFLSFEDYAHVFMHPFKLNSIRFKCIKFQGVEVSTLLNSEIFENSCDHISLLAILYYRFALKLSKSDLKVNMLLDWYENQVIDRALIKGFREFMPDVQVVGYQGYIISKGLHLYTQPNNSEYDAKCVPHKVAVTGKALVENIKEFCDKVEVIIAPGFRFQNLYKISNINKNVNFSILIALPLNLEDAVNIIKIVLESDIQKMGYKVYIKPHPTTDIEYLKKFIPDPNIAFFVFVQGSFHAVLDKVHLVITNASSVALESLAKATPVIVVAPSTGIVQNPIPDYIPQVCWNLCTNVNQINESIDFFKKNQWNIKEYNAIAVRIKKDFFEPVNRNSVLKLLKLND